MPVVTWEHSGGGSSPTVIIKSCLEALLILPPTKIESALLERTSEMLDLLDRFEGAVKVCS